MSHQDSPNYPNLLAYITQEKAVSLNVIQAAIATRPSLIRGGRPFEVILLLQNMADVNVEVTATPHVPHKDADGVPDQFLARPERLVIALRPAEVGYAVLPVLARAGTAISDRYRMTVDLEIKTASKPKRMRESGDQQEINLDYYFNLSEDTMQDIVELKSLEFFAKKHGLRGNSLEFRFGVFSEQPGKRPKIRPRWVSLWSLERNTDARPLLERYHSTLESAVDNLNIDMLANSLQIIVDNRLSVIGRDIDPAELYFITRLFLAIIALSQQNYAKNKALYPQEDQYRVKGLLASKWATDGTPIQLPFWCRALLQRIDTDQAVANQPMSVLAGPLFEALLRDAILHAFRLIQTHLGEPIGDPQEMEAYADYLVSMLWQQDEPLSAVDLYVPLVLGGMLIDQVLVPSNQKPLDMIHEVVDLVEGYRKQAVEESQDDFVLVDRVINYALQKYGYRL